MLAQPELSGILGGFVPRAEIVTNPDMLYLALGILGATVMPHNLYLHTAIVQTRAYGESEPEKREAIRFATLDSTVALLFALMINASILILAAASFHARGETDVEDLGQAHSLLMPLLGAAAAPVALRHRAALLRPLLHRDGDDGRPGGDGRLSQAAARALAPPPHHPRPCHHSGGGRDHLRRRRGRGEAADLLAGGAEPAAFLRGHAARHVHRRPRKMGVFVSPRWLTAVAVLIAAVIVILNLKLVFDFARAYI